MNKTIWFFLLLCAFSINAGAQVTSSSHARATVVEPVMMTTKAVETSLGTVAVIIAGTVEVVPARIPIGTPNITVPVSGTFTAASFVIEGRSAYAYTITVPPSPLEVKSNAGTMVVNSFSSDPIINSVSGLSSGVFVSVTPLNLTVNYN